MGAALADADKAVRYCIAAGERALRLLAFEEAVGHLSRGARGGREIRRRRPLGRCDALIALAEAQNRAGDAAQASANFARAAVLARSIGDPERLATTALRAGPAELPRASWAPTRSRWSCWKRRVPRCPNEDSHLRARITAQLGLVTVAAAGVPAPGSPRAGAGS